MNLLFSLDYDTTKPISRAPTACYTTCYALLSSMLQFPWGIRRVLFISIGKGILEWAVKPFLSLSLNIHSYKTLAYFVRVLKIERSALGH